MTEQLISFETAKLAKEKGFYLTDIFYYVYQSENTDILEKKKY